MQFLVYYSFFLPFHKRVVLIVSKTNLINNEEGLNMIELKGEITGLGILVVVPQDPNRGFLSLQELTNKRSTHKVAGSRTLPMETTEAGETSLQTLNRLTTEEIQLKGFTYDPQKVLNHRLCTCELRPGVLVPTYLLPVPPDVDVKIGSESQEVADIRWMTFKEVVKAPRNDLGLRPGTREAVQAYLDYLRNPTGFRPKVYRYADIADHIPDAIFREIENGTSLVGSLYRLGFASAPFARSVVLAHSQLPQESPLNFAEVK